MSANPKFSVCIASYNHGQYLRQALDSILAQTYRDFEIVVVDDGSTDDSLELLESYAARHPAIKVFTHPNRANRGISTTTNLAIERSRGEYVAFLGSDDAWGADKLARQLPVLESRPEVGLVYGSTYVIDHEGRQAPGWLAGDDAARPDAMAAMIRRNRVPALTAVVRRECFERLGLFDESLIYSDWEMWLRIMAHWKVAFVETPLAFYRVHSFNVSVGIKADVHLRRELDVVLALRRKATLIKGLFTEPRVLALLDLRASYTRFFLHEEDEATRSLLEALEADAGLRTDPRGFARWLSAQVRDGSDVLTQEPTSRDFGEWTLSRLPAMIGAAFTKRVRRYLSAYESAGAARACDEADAPQAMRFVLRSWLTDPRQLAERDLAAISLKAIVGRKVVGRIGKVKRACAGYGQRSARKH